MSKFCPISIFSSTVGQTVNTQSEVNENKPRYQTTCPALFRVLSLIKDKGSLEL